MSQSANSEQAAATRQWSNARDQLFRMIMNGRSFSGRERNVCFLNTGTDRFATISAVAGVDFPDDGRCIGVTDWDGDGDLDLWTSNRSAPRLRFLHNEGPQAEQHFVSLQLQGNGTTTNRDAIGARVEVQSTGGPPGIARQTLRVGEGFLSQSSKWLHFGLGRASRIEQIIVEWPGGVREIFSEIPLDRRVQLRQGSGVAVLVEPRSPLIMSPTEQVSLPPATRNARVALMTRVPMISLDYATAHGQSKVERFQTGRPVLINLWASWCGPCMQEMTEWNRRRDDLEAAGLKVLSLSVDRLGEEPTADRDVEQRVAQLDYRHDWGFLDASMMDRLQSLHEQFFFLKRPLPLPTSLLIDRQGRLAVIYRGPVAVDTLLDDCQRCETYTDYEHAADDAACFPGRPLAHPRVETVNRQADQQMRYQIAAGLEQAGAIDDAMEHFQVLTSQSPEFALAWWHLAKLHLTQNRLDDAMRYAQRSLQLDSHHAGTNNTMGLIYSRMGDQDLAEKYLRAAINNDDRLAEAHNNLGTILASRDQMQEAETQFAAAVKLDEQFAEAHTNLGSVYAGRRDWPRAIEHFQRALTADPKYVDAYNNLGTVYATQADYGRAVEYYERAARLDPRRDDVRRNLQRAQQLLEGRRRRAANQ